jgi:hypothetical protein
LLEVHLDFLRFLQSILHFQSDRTLHACFHSCFRLILKEFEIKRGKYKVQALALLPGPRLGRFRPWCP